MKIQTLIRILPYLRRNNSQAELPLRCVFLSFSERCLVANSLPSVFIFFLM